MRPGLFAFAVGSGFLGAALYINVVEQPARLVLDTRAMIREWNSSNRRASILLATLAIISSLLAFADFAFTGDVRWLIGGTVMLASWPYSYFVVVPVNIWLYTIPPGSVTRQTLRALMRDWGLLEWGQTAIGVAACYFFAWALLLPV
jgi:hypothetical protein